MREHRTSSCLRNPNSQRAETNSNARIAVTKIHISATNSFTALNRASSLRKNLDTLRWIDRRGHVAIEDLQFSASGLVCDCGYLSLYKFAAVKADAGAYAVVHIVSILVLIITARRLPPFASPKVESGLHPI
jgi:hypothetical protein